MYFSPLSKDFPNLSTSSFAIENYHQSLFRLLDGQSLDWVVSGGQKAGWGGLYYNINFVRAITG